MSTIEELDKNECCGCSSCVQRCPKNAITMVENLEGFLYPKIDKNKCIDCGLCIEVCPQFKKIINKSNEYPKAYAMYNKNEDELLKSSSGGIFSVVANYVLDNEGIVFGAAYTERLDVKHIKIDKKSGLEKLRSSKYVQSDINNTYKEVEELLRIGKIVLFSGTPCQIAGLSSFLIKDYDNLITCDLVCHGVPSQKLFHTYLDYLSKKFKSKVKSYNFRSKNKYGWGLFSEVITDNGKIHYIKSDFDPYYSNFLSCNTYRECCYKCHYSNYNRTSDLTLADYWGISSIHPEFYSINGRSLVLINTKNGENIINKVLPNIKKIDTSLNIAASKNKNLIKPSYRPKSREIIYSGIYSKESNEYIKENLKVKYTLTKIIKYFIPVKLQNYFKIMRGKIK